MVLSQLIEGAQELIENGDGNIRGLRGGALRESDHVGEKDADIIEPIRDRVLLAFQPLSDLRWQDVEEQLFGSLHGLVALDPEVGQNEGDDGSHAAQVEYEERSLSTVRQRRNRSSQRRIDQSGHGSHGDEPAQPRPSGPRPEENESAEGGKEGPHDDRAALDIATEARLEHRGQQQDQEQDKLTEPPEFAASHQSHSHQSRRRPPPRGRRPTATGAAPPPPRTRPATGAPRPRTPATPDGPRRRLLRAVSDKPSRSQSPGRSPQWPRWQSLARWRSPQAIPPGPLTLQRSVPCGRFDRRARPCPTGPRPRRADTARRECRFPPATAHDDERRTAETVPTPCRH